MRERPQRIFGDEANLAARIAQVRQERGLSLAQLAELMDMHPPIPTTAIYRIEKGQRSIRVDELIAFGRALDLDLIDLLTPIELLGRQDAERVAERVRAAMANLFTAARELASALAELRQLHHEAPEAGEYLLNLLAAPFWARMGQGSPDRSSTELAADELAQTLIGDLWWATYAGEPNRFFNFLIASGLGVVPDPREPMQHRRTGEFHVEH